VCESIIRGFELVHGDADTLVKRTGLNRHQATGRLDVAGDYDFPQLTVLLTPGLLRGVTSIEYRKNFDARVKRWP
jgi:hypothetical protein